MKSRRWNIRVLAGALLLLLGVMPGREQNASRAETRAETRAEAQAMSLRLANGTAVAVLPLLGREEEHRYRYLPANLSLSRRRDSVPEFSFLPYRQNDTSAIDGAIMHLLLRWGLSMEQENELQQLIRGLDTLGVLDGAVAVRPAREGKSWEITSTGAIGTILNRGVSSAGHIPVTPGSKFAVSFRFDSQDANMVAEALRGKRGAWGEKFRFLFTYDNGNSWVLEADLGTLFPRGGK